MKKSLSFKLILTLLMTFCIFSLMIPKTYALGDIISSADQFANMGETKVDAGGGLGMNSDSNGNPIKKMSDIIFNVLFIFELMLDARPKVHSYCPKLNFHPHRLFGFL